MIQRQPLHVQYRFNFLFWISSVYGWLSPRCGNQGYWGQTLIRKWMLAPGTTGSRAVTMSPEALLCPISHSACCCVMFLSHTVCEDSRWQLLLPSLNHLHSSWSQRKVCVTLSLSPLDDSGPSWDICVPFKIMVSKWTRDLIEHSKAYDHPCLQKGRLRAPPGHLESGGPSFQIKSPKEIKWIHVY